MRRVLVLVAVLLAGYLNFAGPLAGSSAATTAAAHTAHSAVADVQPYGVCNGTPLPC